jgi:hypothetical protein
MESCASQLKHTAWSFHRSLRGTTRKPDVSLLATKKEGQCAEGLCK